MSIEVGDKVRTLVPCDGVPAGSVVEVTSVWGDGVDCLSDGIFCDYFTHEFEIIADDKTYTDWSDWTVDRGDYDDTEEYKLPGGQIVYRGRDEIKPVEESGESWAYRHMGGWDSGQFADFNINGKCNHGKYTATHLEGKLVKFVWEAYK